jgi:5'-3' exonuclease
VNLIPSYKTHRVATEEDLVALEETPDTLGPQIGAIYRLLDAWGVAVVGVDGYEADDIIATLARTYEDVVVVSGDRDMVQVVSETAQLFLAVNGGMDKWPLLNWATVRERYGVTPDQYVQVAALRGDPSDGLPGVPGIGEKTATKLISEFGGLERVLEAAASESCERPLTPRLAQLLNTHSEYLAAAIRVSTAATDVSLPEISPAIPTEPRKPKEFEELCTDWGVRRQVHEALDLAE